MASLRTVLARLRRRPVDPERALARARADAARRAAQDGDVRRGAFRGVDAGGGFDGGF